jgi:hypothetical protein
MITGHFYHWGEIGQLVGHEPCGYLTQVDENIVCGCFRKDWIFRGFHGYQSGGI